MRKPNATTDKEWNGNKQKSESMRAGKGFLVPEQRPVEIALVENGIWKNDISLSIAEVPLPFRPPHGVILHWLSRSS